MSFGPVTIFAATMASGGDSCSVTFPKAYANIFLECPTMSTAADRNVYTSADGTTFRQARYPHASGVTTPLSYVIGSGCTSCGFRLDVHAKAIKLEASATVAGGGTYKFICSD